MTCSLTVDCRISRWLPPLIYLFRSMLSARRMVAAKKTLYISFHKLFMSWRKGAEINLLFTWFLNHAIFIFFAVGWAEFAKKMYKTNLTFMRCCWVELFRGKQTEKTYWKRFKNYVKIIVNNKLIHQLSAKHSFDRWWTKISGKFSEL
jgi:hypothetical protein